MNCKLPPGPCTTNTDHRLKLYACAAVAAGVGIIALAQSAPAEVVVTQKTIHLDAGFPVSIDLNNDGIPDFEFSDISYRTQPLSHFHGKLTLKGLTGGKAIGRRSKALGPIGGPYASALARGAHIGPSAHFASFRGGIVIEREIHYSSAGAYYGNWYYRLHSVLGVKFQIKGQTHYGWIRITSDVGIPRQIEGWGYETVANKPVIVGQGGSSVQNAALLPLGGRSAGIGSPSLGMLALGAEGQALWRRDEHFDARLPATQTSN